MPSDWCLRFLNILPTVLLGYFRQCLVYFLKRYLATHRRIRLSHIWQPIMPEVRAENVEEEECYTFILPKCPAINKEFKYHII